MRRRGDAVVLGYHRVADVSIDPADITVSPRRFEEHLDVVASMAEVLPLEAAVESGTARRGPAVAITFDDGYRDNVEVARPLLTAAGATATVFVPTCAIGSDRDYWWDEIETLVFRSSGIPERLKLETPDGSIAWDGGSLPEGADLGGDHRRWCVWKHEPRTRRQELYAVLWSALRPLDAADRREALDTLIERHFEPPRSHHPTLTRPQVANLGRDEVLSPGGHGSSHSPLEGLPADRQHEEIADSARELSALVGHPVRSMSYPFGSYDRTTKRVARAAGFALAFTTARKGVRRHTDRFAVPRLMVRNWTADEFRRELSRVLAV